MKKLYESPEFNKLMFIKEDILTSSRDNVFEDEFDQRL